MYDVLVKNGKLVTPDRIYEADIAIQDGKYAGFFAKGAPVDAKEVIDAKGKLCISRYHRLSCTSE